MSMDLEEQYDKIYRYCYFRLHNRETAEDITQETFLRFFEKYHINNGERAMKYLYTIARNLCIDEYRRKPLESLDDHSPDNLTSVDLSKDTTSEDRLLTSLVVKSVLSEMEIDEQELLLLRYVNEVSVSTISQIFGISRFAVRRRLMTVTKKFKNKLGKEEVY